MAVTRTHFTFRVSKRKPRTRRGFQLASNKGETLEGPGSSLDAPILSQGTNQARRGSHKRPDPPPSHDGPGLVTTAFRPVTGRPVMTKNNPSKKARL
jgi:hypothetical protein